MPTEKTISALAANPTTNMLYIVTNDYDYESESGYTTIYFVNGTTNSLEDLIQFDQVPSAIAVNPKTNTIYALGYAADYYELPMNYGYIRVIDSGMYKIVDEIELKNTGGTEFDYIAINPNANMIYVTSLASDSVSFIDGKTNDVLR